LSAHRLTDDPPAVLGQPVACVSLEPGIHSVHWHPDNDPAHGRPPAGQPARRARRWIPAASAGGTIILQVGILTVIPAPDQLLAALALAWITA
jgi:hypothetical protein